MSARSRRGRGGFRVVAACQNGAMAREVTLVTGPEPFLVERQVREAVEQTQQRHPELEVARLSSSSGEDGLSLSERLTQNLSPSLFGEPPIVVVPELATADETAIDLIRSELTQEGSPLIIGHNGAARGRGVINAAKKADCRIITVKKLREADLRSLVNQVARESGGQLSPEAGQRLVEAIGTDQPELLVSAVRQAVADAPEGRVDESAVHTMVPLQARISSFQVVDHIWAGRLPEAVRLLRGMEQRERGVGVAVIAAIAHGLRMMAVAESGSSIEGLGVAPWQLDRARRNLRSWHATSARIAHVVAALPEYDATMKGGLGDGVALDDEQKLAVVEELVVRLAAGDRPDVVIDSGD